MSNQRDQLAATLREVLASFTEVKSVVGPSRVLAYNGHVVSPDVFARWRSVLDEAAPEGTTHGDPFLSTWQTNPTAGTPEDAAAQLDMARDLDRALNAGEDEGEG